MPHWTTSEHADVISRNQYCSGPRCKFRARWDVSVRDRWGTAGAWGAYCTRCAKRLVERTNRDREREKVGNE